MDILQALQYVGTGLSLVAFAVAALLLVYRARLANRADIIKSAPENERLEAIATTVEFFRVDVSRLTRAQQQDIALKQIDARARRDLLLAGVSLTVAILLAAIALATVWISKPPGPPIVANPSVIVRDIFGPVTIGPTEKPLEDRARGVRPEICRKAPAFTCENRGNFIVANVSWDDPIHGLWIRDTPSFSPLLDNKRYIMPSNAIGIAVDMGKCKEGACPAQCGAWSGWVGQGYITFLPDARRTVAAMDSADRSLSVFSGPHSTCEKLDRGIPHDARDVIVHSCQPSPIDGSRYCEITYDKESGWVQAKYLQQLPDGFVYLRDIAPTIVQDIRYGGTHNFMGRPIIGYNAKECVLTEQAARALVPVQQVLAKEGRSLIVWDCYRPARAVRQFVAWASNPSDIAMKREFYPDFDKTQSIGRYLSAPSPHSRGSAVDVGIVPDSVREPPQSEYFDLKSCAAPKGQRFEDGTIDLGTGFDCFDIKARFDDPSVGAEAQKNRAFLRYLMATNGFQVIDREWWHFELRVEPFPYREFDFTILSELQNDN